MIIDMPLGRFKGSVDLIMEYHSECDRGRLEGFYMLKKRTLLPFHVKQTVPSYFGQGTVAALAKCSQ